MFMFFIRKVGKEIVFVDIVCQVLELREKRLDQEDQLAEINKAVEDIKKHNERLQV